MSIQTKIYLTLVLWLAFCAGMFTYGFNILQNSNGDALTTISQEKDVLLNLQAEQDSYRSAQKDLENLTKKDLQPQDFFSKDVTLVKELRELENLGKTNKVDLAISGISGTINTLSQAKTQSELYVMPFQMAVSGSLSDVMNFVESLYNLDFVVTINSMTLGASDQNHIGVSMSANFYISK